MIGVKIVDCNDHKDIDIVQCVGSKCNNCYELIF